MVDKRFVYGAHCTWFGSISEVIVRRGLPACPHCGNVLFEMENEQVWQAGVDKHDVTHPGYREMIEWARGKCFGTRQELEEAYKAETEMVGFKKIPASELHVKARMALIDALKSFGDDLTPMEQLGIVAYLTGQLLAFQDQTKGTADSYMEMIIRNIELGNIEAIKTVLGGIPHGNA